MGARSQLKQSYDFSEGQTYQDVDEENSRFTAAVGNSRLEDTTVSEPA